MSRATTRPRWSAREDAILLAKVKENPQNLKTAFYLTAEEIGRTPMSCSTRWYSVVSKVNDKGNTCFVTLSKKSYGRNRKNCIHEYTQQQRSKWRRILDILFS